MKSLILICLLSLVSSISFTQDYQDYKFTHPKPQSNLLRKIKMIDNNTWVTAGANGVFMKTTNHGSDWYFHFKAGRYLNAAQTIGQNYDLWFFNSSNGIVVGDRGYIGKTTDGGVTFDSVGIGVIPISQRIESIWFADQNTGFVVTGNSEGSIGMIARTTNGGNNWTNVLNNTSSFSSVYGTGTSLIYAVAINGSIFKSTNSGLNWTQFVSAVPTFIYSITFLDQNIGFVTGDAGVISRTTNAGTSWDTLSSPQTEWTFFQVKAISANEIYLVGDPGYLYKSSDLGNTWTSISLSSIVGSPITYIWYSLEKIGSTITICGDLGVVIRSDDNGLTWATEHKAASPNLIFDIEKVPGTNIIFAVGRQNEQGTKQLLVSTDEGFNWAARDLGVNFDASAISMVNSQVGYISGTNAQILKTTDGGTNWNPLILPVIGTYNIYSLDFINQDTGWAFINYSVLPGGNVIKTTDGGTSWTQQTIGVNNSISHADMVNSTVGYLSVNSSNRPIYKTTDGGSNWFAVTTPLIGNINAIKALDENNLFIGASFGNTRMAKSTNGGTNWIPITLPISVDIKSLDFMDADTGYVCGNTTTVVCRTTNGGNNWSFENLHLPALVKVVVLPGDLVFVSGSFASLLRYGHSTTMSVSLNNGWNIISVPLLAPSMVGTQLFPTVQSNFYSYDNGYQSILTLENGKGYWAKFGSVQNNFISGNPIPTASISVGSGWNLIGPYDEQISVGGISSTPAGIITTNFYVYNNGYQVANTLDLGKGYWVKTSQSGTINFNAISADKSGISSIDNWGKINFTDSKGNKAVLYVVNDGTDLSMFEMPPKPPIEILDIRFDNSLIAENLNSSKSIINVNSLDYPIQVSVEGIKINLSDNISGKILNQNITPGEVLTLRNNAFDKLKIQFIEVPTEYSLEQNYPNPFNPSTSILYAISSRQLVTLKIYDILGNEVSTLVNETMEAGKYNINFNASQLSSGVYFYSIKAGDFTQTKKMLLIK